MASSSRGRSLSLVIVSVAFVFAFPAALFAVGLADTAEEPDFKKLGVPRYPGMTFVVGTVEKEGKAEAPAEGGPKQQGPTSAMDFFVYSTPDTIEQVVDFYEKKFDQKAHWSKPKDLTQKFPFQKIPERSKGRQATFVVRDPDDSATLQNPNAKMFGKAHVVVSDYCMDPQMAALVPKTTIMFVQLKFEQAQELLPPPPRTAPWPPPPPVEVKPPPPAMP